MSGSGCLMFRKIDCGCVYETFRDHYGTYDKKSIQRFIICKSCVEQEKNLSDDEVECETNKVIEFLKNEDLEYENNWFSAPANSSLCFMK